MEVTFMRKLFLTCFSLIVIIVFMTGCFYGATDVATESDNNEPDFRQVKWGMSREEVIQIEGEPSGIYNENKLNYWVTVSGYFGNLEYEFVNDKLFSASYSFHESNEYECFVNLLSGLKQKYGNPNYGYDKWADFNACEYEWNLSRTDIKIEIRVDYNAPALISNYKTEIKYISKIDLSTTNTDTDGL
jgi:hypothetical protein